MQSIYNAIIENNSLDIKVDRSHRSIPAGEQVVRGVGPDPLSPAETIENKIENFFQTNNSCYLTENAPSPVLKAKNAPSATSKRA